jgi:hypothetical protein
VNAPVVQHEIADWIQTFTGRQFYPTAPRAEDVDIRDIAHALSNTCRYGGHCEYHYSVAQHSYYVSYTVPQEFALEALLHDATEAYCVDVPRPLKKSLTNYKEIEDRIWTDAIAPRFGLPVQLPECVHWADNAVLLTEKEQLLKTSAPWSITGEPAQIQILQWDPKFAEQKFLERFEDVWDKRKFQRFISKVYPTQP